jgi:holliday junction DNA helicase RuvA
VLYTHLAVRENALDLYGFALRDELSMFEHLITIPKIGPKSAMQVLSQADVALLTTAIVKNDATYLSKMSGISKKTSEKIVSELQSKFEDVVLESGETGMQGEDADIVDALIALGYSQKDARDALLKLPQEMRGTNARIKEALKQLGT